MTRYLLAALLLASCATSKPAEPLPQASTDPSPGLPLYRKQLEEAGVADIHVGDMPTAPVAPINPTRQARKAYKATLTTYQRQLNAWEAVQKAQAKAQRGPLFVGKGAVNAPQAREVVNAYKPSAPVVKADTGATVYAASSTKGPAVAGTGNTVTTPAPLTFWQRVKGWLYGSLFLTVPLAAVVLAAAVKYRRRLPFIGPFFA
jgi:hypothetical protein